MNILMIHQNFPGQYRHVAAALAAMPGNRVVALCHSNPYPVDGVRIIAYDLSPASGTPSQPWAGEYDTKLRYGLACAEAADRLKQSGFVPDIVLAHLGWGEAMFIKAVFPNVPLLGLVEFFFRPTGFDAGFDPEFNKLDGPARAFRMSQGAYHLLSIVASDHGQTATHWQRASIPDSFHHKITVAHEGIDTDKITPAPDAVLTLPGTNVTVKTEDEVLTYVARNLEPHRGFPSLMRALPLIQKRRPNLLTIIVGGEETSYSVPLPNGTYKELMLQEVGAHLDLSRVHFVGRIPYRDFYCLVQISSVHLYLTYPFVLSWSMLEAMSAGALVIGSATGPVTEIIEDGKNGILCDFFDYKDIANRVVNALAQPQKYNAIKTAARQTIVDRFDLTRICLPRQLALIKNIAA